MKIGLRVLLGYFVIVALAAWLLGNVFVQQVKPGVELQLAGQAGIFDQRHRRIARQASVHQPARNRGRRCLAHIDRQRRVRIGQQPPIEIERFARARMRGDECQLARQPAQSE